MRIESVRNIRTKLQQIPLEILIAAAPWVMIGPGLITALLVALFAVLGRLRYWLFAINVASLLVVFGLLLYLLLRRVSPYTLENLKRYEPSMRVVLLSLYLGIALLIIPVSLSAWDSTDYDLQWTRFGFMDKRYLLLLYWTAMATLLLFPFLANRLLSFRNNMPAGSEPPQLSFRKNKILLRLCMGIIIACYFTGPPWNLNRGDLVVMRHEFTHLASLQAIHKGYPPYLGPASTQYGPGSQLFTYLYTHWMGNFSFVGIREASAALLFFSFTLFCVAAMLVLPIRGALLAILLSVGFSPFIFYSWENGSLTGFWGWANPVRYIGGALLILSLPSLYESMAQKPVNIGALFAGFLWGLFSYMSQENLPTGILGILFLSSVLWASQTFEWRSIARVWMSLAAGFLLFWLVPICYYHFHGGFLQFLSNYLLIPRLVSAGYQNIPFLEGLFSRAGIAYMLTPILLAIAGLFLVLEVPHFKIRRRLTADQIRFLSILTIVLVCYPVSMLRSDRSHFINVMIGIPLFIAIVVMEPFWLAAAPLRRKLLYRGLIFVLLLAIYPHQWHSILTRPLQRFSQSRNTRSVAVDRRVGAERLELQPSVKTPPIKELLSELAVLKSSVGESRVLIESFPGVFPGVIYFLGDFHAAPYLFDPDPDSLVVNSRLLEINLIHMQTNIDEFDLIITETLDSPYVKLFRQLRPQAAIQVRQFKGFNYYIVGTRNRFSSMLEQIGGNRQ